MAEQEMEFCKNCKIPKELCPKVCNIKTIEVGRKVLPEGTILHQDYQIYGAIGAGGMSVTYCACTRLKPVLLKQFNLTSGNRKELDLDLEKEREKFGEEARKLLTLNHPNIVRIEDIVIDKETKEVFLVMELLYGETLEKYLQGLQEPMPEQEAYQMLAPIFDALETVHQAGIIHRDIKPSNIMICGVDQTIKLIDFGNARPIDKHTKSAIVSSGYAPQEQYDPHGKQGTWTDVYALSAVIYRMITGKEPQPSWQRCMKDTIEIPEGLKHREELKKGLALEVEDRWQTMKELRAALGIASLSENAKYAAKKSLKKVAKVAGDKIAEGFAFDVYEPEREQETQRVQIDESKSRETEYMRQETRRAETNKNKGKTAESVQADISEDDENDLTAEEMYQLGEKYNYGKGVVKDKVRAFYWYQQAAQNGSAAGMCNLGYCYRHGIGTEKDENKALCWYKEAAENGNARGMYNLGYCYQHGIGTSKDEKKADYWYREAKRSSGIQQYVKEDKSWDRGTEDTESKSAQSVETNKNKERTAESVQANISETDENNLTAEEMYQLGENYYYGKGILVDEEKAVYWYKKAAEAGNADGMYSLGDVYRIGIGIEKNDREAFCWYKKAAEAGNADGMRSLSYCYDYGIGTEEDEEEAIYWQKRANGLGSRHTKKNKKDESWDRETEYVPPETQTLKIDESWNQETEYIQPIETDESGRTVVETKTEKESEHKNFFQRIFGL